MKWVIGTMVGFYFLSFWIFPLFYQWIFPWGDVTETHLHPIYMGLILLSGLIVASTKVILGEIRAQRENNTD